MTDTELRTSGTSETTASGAWAVLLPAERYEAERLVHHDTLELTGLEGVVRPRPGDPVAVLVDEPLRLVALGRVALATAETREDPDDPQSEAGPGELVVTYTRRVLDEPVPVDDLLALDGPVTGLDLAAWRELAARLGPPPARRSWLVSLDLPIEAASPAEAVRLFWSYVQELGPRELPAFVSPSGDELAMQAYVLGVVANQDPEEDD
ncbi:hypothetical protein ONA91_17440 [Micromonospora sp. DR5-3]|uniref:hypothetical protein n=1 Tax=unclassified Micromonospora TaxID=2617518 RepID=UPI0011D3A3BC|nr:MULTISPECIES: hypothetical protein [unclassified Micromonospora]MCW3816230.1 hypothetical protein [Micromonospora sp. DR5-3]TYC23953.1 hypothetical protein FXF52_13040 [Micromonospora sp. MP36]